MIETEQDIEPDIEHTLEEKRRYQLTKNLSFGVWLSKYNRVKVTKVKGKFVNSMGFSSNLAADFDSKQQKHIKSLMLYPEEALFLVENTHLVVCHDQITDVQVPLSIQQCYESFFNNTDFETDGDDPNDSAVHLSDYMIYSHLVKLGFIVRRSGKLHSNAQSIPDVEPSTKETSKVDLVENESIIKPSEYGQLSCNETFSRLNDLIPNISLEELKQKILYHTRGFELTPKYQLLYDVYLPDKSFKKSQPGRPLYQVFTCTEPGEDLCWPDITDFVLNDRGCDYDQTEQTETTNRALCLYAFVDNADVLFYSFNATEGGLTCIFNTYNFE